MMVVRVSTAVAVSVKPAFARFTARPVNSAALSVATPAESAW